MTDFKEDSRVNETQVLILTSHHDNHAVPLMPEGRSSSAENPF